MVLPRRPSYHRPKRLEAECRRIGQPCVRSIRDLLASRDLSAVRPQYQGDRLAPWAKVANTEHVRIGLRIRGHGDNHPALAWAGPYGSGTGNLRKYGEFSGTLWVVLASTRRAPTGPALENVLVLLREVGESVTPSGCGLHEQELEVENPGY
jgi:hypothetical protein